MMSKINSFKQHIHVNNIINESNIEGMTEEQMEQKLVEILFKSTSEIDLENKLEEYGFDNYIAMELMMFCKEMASAICEEREHQIKVSKLNDNKSKFKNLFVDFITEKIDSDFPGLTFAPVKWIGKTNEEILTYNAVLVYSAHITTPSEKPTTVYVYVKEDELYIALNNDDDNDGVKSYDISDLVEVIENKK